MEQEKVYIKDSVTRIVRRNQKHKQVIMGRTELPEL